MHTDINNRPSDEGLEDHQLWVWMQGANPPRWEIRGTGTILDDEMLAVHKERKTRLIEVLDS